MIRFILWWFYGYNNAFRFDNERPRKNSIGLGGNIAASLKKYIEDSGKDMFTDSGNDNTSGNGSIIRNAAIPICFYQNMNLALQMAQKQSKVTHQGNEAAGCCQLLTYIIILLLNGKNLQDTLNNLEKGFYCQCDSVNSLAYSKIENNDPNRDWRWNQSKYTYSIERAKANPIELVNLLCKDFNIRQNSVNAWLTFEDLNNEEIYTDWKDSYCVGGCDLSSTTDLTCATLLGVVKGKIRVKQMYWIPTNYLEKKVAEDKIPYDKWLKTGWLRLSGDSKIDYHDITKWFLEEVQENDLRPLWIGYDSWNAEFWKQEMVDSGFDMVEVRQGYKTESAPLKQMKADLMDKKINYNNNPILKWNLSNVAIKQDDNENIMITKEKSRQRIDGVASLMDAYVIFVNKRSEYLDYINEEV